MTSSTQATSDRLSFGQLVRHSRVRASRRDMLRVSAVIGAASCLPLSAITASASPDPSSRAMARAQSRDAELGLPLNLFGQALTLDPHRAPNWGPFWVTLPYCWSGLLRFNENGAVEPDLAESVEPNDDGSVWTAKLRDGIAYANGDPIVASHFVQSWKRALDPALVAPMAPFFDPIKGAAEFRAGTGTDIGAVAKDDTTLEITLTGPLSHFPAYLATFVYAAVNPAFFAPEGDNDPIALADATSGPWRIDALDEATSIRMVPNEGAWSEPPSTISSLLWKIAPGGNTDDTILSWYQGDDIAVADVPPGLLDRVQDDDKVKGELVEIKDHISTLALTMDFNQAPFDDVRVRRALAQGIDKDAWAKEIQHGAFAPASSLTPPMLKTIAHYRAPDGIAYSADDARASLEDAGFDPESGDVSIVLFEEASDTDTQKQQTQALLDAIRDAIGLDVALDANLTREQITAARQDSGGLQLALIEWWNDSITPSLLKTVAGAKSPYNVGWINWTSELEATEDFDPGKASADFNTLVDDAIATMDEDERNAKFADAEKLLLEHAIYIPLGHRVQRYLQKPWLTGTRQGPWSGSTPVRIDADVSIDRE